MSLRETFLLNREPTNILNGAGEFGFLIPSRKRDFYLLQNVQMPNQPRVQRVPQFFSGSKSAGV